MEGSTNTAEAVERITNTLAYARSVGNNDRNSYPFRVGDVDRLLSRITELEKLVAELTWSAFIAAGGDVPADDEGAST